MKKNIFKRIFSGFVSATVMLSVVSLININAETEETKSSYNYAEALQKAIYFYDANKCGVGVTGGALDWRGDCHTEDAKVPLEQGKNSGLQVSSSYIQAHLDAFDPDGNGYADVAGGFHDAGDHVKFGLPQAYAGSTVGWGYYEFRNSYVKINEQEHIEDILRWFNDYFMKCTFRDPDGTVAGFAYQVGDGNTDHFYWGSPELQTTPRPVYVATPETPASDQCAGASASLAINYLNFKETDAEYAEKSLDTAIALYEFAKENRGLGFSGGYYNSSYDEDEMSWAAVWLYLATGNYDYITDIASTDNNGMYTGYMKKIIATTANTWQNIWVHSWDTVWGGVFAKLAPITNDPNHWYMFRWNCEYWSGVKHADSKDTAYLQTTPGGFAFLNSWGSARYNAAAQLCCLVYNKYDEEPKFVDWAKSQMNYLLGDNPMERCYEVGYAENSAQYPHHRAAHASTTNSMLDPKEQTNILWGALVGGPDSSDAHVDARTDYVYNEVAIDYNAGFVGALAGLYEIYGEDMKPLADFPPKSETELALYTTAKLEQDNNERTQVTIKVHNESFQPPVYYNNIKARYYFNLSEMLEAGQTPDDIEIQVMYDQSAMKDNKNVVISKPIPYDEASGIYYVELDWTGMVIHGSREIHIGFIAKQDAAFTAHWNTSNDWSHQGLAKDETITENIPLYLGDELVFGSEPSAAGEGIMAVITSPSYEEIFDFTKNPASVTVTADAECNGDEISKVIFYENDVKIGEDAQAPYEITYQPKKIGADENGIKAVNLKAEAVTSMGIKAYSDEVNVTYIFTPVTGVEIEIAEPADGTVIDTLAGEKSVDIRVETDGDTESIEQIEIYADDKLIGIGNSVIFSAEGLEADTEDGTRKVIIKAKAILNDGTEVYSEPAEINVKLLCADTYKALYLENQGSAVASDNTLTNDFIITNTGKTSMSLEGLSVMYYYTDETNVQQVFNPDVAGMELASTPYYASVSSLLTAEFTDVNFEKADTCLKISFENIPYKLAPGKSIKISFRITNSSWSNYDKSNDYSYKNADGLVFMYGNMVISGAKPL